MKWKSNKRDAGGHWLAWVCVWVWVCGSCLQPAIGYAADNEPVAIDDTREALAKWVQTQQLISQEKKDLALSREMLNARIELVRHEIESLQEKIQKAEDSIAEADKKREEMMQQNEKLKASSASLVDTVATLESKTQNLLKRLPDPIRDRVKPLSQRLPQEDKETKLSVSERFQNVVGILNEVDKFNRDISVFSEIRTFNDGSSVEVTALYLGLGQGFYASANGSVAGIGTATDQGWVWKEDNLAASQISDVIAILKNEKVASFVQVPVEIQ